MNKYLSLLLLAIISIFISACAQKVVIKAIEPAEIDRATSTKKIAVTKFKNDKAGLSSKIESILSKHRIENKRFFTMISRSDTDKIIKEQKLQNSGLVDTATIVGVGNLIGAEAIISGNVGKSTLADTSFYENRSKCADKKCKELVYYKVRCIKRVVGLSAEIKMVDITKGDIIYADNIRKTLSYKHCSDDSLSLPSKETVIQKIASLIANKFAYKLTPHYKYFKVELLDEPDLDYDDAQEELLENSLIYIERNRYDKAEQLLNTLIDSTGQQSYVAFYNLGVIKEAKAEYLKAQEYYIKADNLTVEPVEAIDKAYVRIGSVIEKYKLTQEQINR